MPQGSFGDLRLKYAEFNNPQGIPDSSGYRSRIKNYSGGYIEHKPEIRVFELDKDSVGFLLASDGLWDEMDFKTATEMKGKNDGKKYVNILMEKALEVAASNTSFD